MPVEMMNENKEEIAAAVMIFDRREVWSNLLNKTGASSICIDLANQFGCLHQHGGGLSIKLLLSCRGNGVCSLEEKLSDDRKLHDEAFLQTFGKNELSKSKKILESCSPVSKDNRAPMLQLDLMHVRDAKRPNGFATSELKSSCTFAKVVALQFSTCDMSLLAYLRAFGRARALYQRAFSVDISRLVVSDVLSSRAASGALFSVSKSTSLADAAKLMSQRQVSSLFVLDQEHHVAGLVTERDVLHAIASCSTSFSLSPAASLLERHVESLMTPAHKLMFVSPEDPCQICVDLMTRQSVRHILVLDSEQKLIQGTFSCFHSLS